MKQKKSPPLTLSLTTGLLTLSVHDKLTFDGVEVALHPDLFINIGCNLNQGCSSGNVGVGVGVGVGIGSRSASHSRQQSRDSSAFVHQHQHQHSRDASFASSIFNTTPGQTNYNAPATPILVQEEGNAFMRKDTPISMKSASTAGVGNQSPQRQHSSNVLKVGDLIEIKVWEQKNNNHHGQKDVNGNFNANDHQSNVVARAATKLEQVANHQSAVSSSTFQSMMYHPLATDPSSATASTSVSATTATNANTNNKTSLLSSSRPPMVPKSVSNASSTVASPMHSGSFTPSLLPSPRSSHPTPKTLPRMDPSTSIYREDFMNDSNNGNGNGNGNATGNDIDTSNSQTSIPFQAPLEIIGPSSSLVNNGDIFTPHSSNTPTLDRSRSFANADDDDSVNHSLNHNHVSMTGNELGGTLKEVNVQHHQEKQSEIRQQEHQSQKQSQQQDMIGIISNTHVLKTKFVISVTEKSLTTLKSSGRTQISLLKPVAALYNLSSYDTVTVTKIDKSEEALVLESVQADHVTLTIKDQFISRGEMYQFQNYFVGKWIYAGERLKTNDNLRGYIMDVRNGDQELKSGILTNETKITFRSRSARIFWLVQISSEMWDYTSPYSQYVERGNKDGCCEIYFDKFVSFMKRLFEEWKALDVTHSLTILFFSRSYIKSKFNNSSETLAMIASSAEKSSIREDTDGRLYEDFYKTIAENVTKTTSWDSLIIDVKKAFVSYPSDVGWRVSCDNSYSRVPSTAAQGNILEAINTALNVMQLHYIDRDLHRCGNSVVIVSAGSGLFEVDKNLAGITKQRMMDNGIGSDMLSLGLPPLHVAPFFLYKETSSSHPDESHDFDSWKTFFEIPHWMHLSFVAYEQAQQSKVKEASIESQSQPSIRITANGFIVHGKDNTRSHEESNNENKGKDSSKMQRHLVSGRDFEDILEACRPRNRGDRFGGMPKALVSQMKIFGLVREEEENNNSISPAWGSVDFGIGPRDSGSDDKSRSSQSTVASYFTNTYAFILSRSPGSQSNNTSPTMSSVQIQQSRSHEVPSFLLNESKLRMVASEYDKSVFMPDTLVLNESSRPISELEIPSPSKSQHMSGIGEAIHQYETKSETGSSLFPTPQLKREPTTITRVKKGLGTPNFIQPMYSRATSMSFLQEHSNECSTDQLDVTNHTVGFARSTPLEIPRKTSRSMQPSDNYVIGQFKGESLSSFNKDLHPALSSSPRGRKSNNSMSPPSRKKLNTQTAKIVNLSQNKKTQRRQNSRNGMSSRPQPQNSRRKKWVLNPFRQEDEDEVLVMRNFNSRRWSHVFPQGDIEFKRHAGPNFKSLCQPAILPVQIDVYPSQEDFSKNYKFTFYDINLAAMDITYYKTHEDLLMEMVRQRLLQDFQLVHQAVVMKSRKKTEGKKRNVRSMKKSPSEMSVEKEYPRKRGDAKNSVEDTPAISLSMGHRFQTIQYKPEEDAVRVVIYSRHNAMNIKFKYNFKLWVPTSKQFVTVSQSFDKYPDNISWNALDILICGDSDKSLTERTRYRRLSFRIIPDLFQDQHGEQEYIKKIRRFIEFLEKQAQKKLDIDIISSEEEERQKRRSEVKFIVHLRKTKRDKYEWMEVVISPPNYHTKRSFHITFRWLVASSVKIDTQVQLLQRRCSQYGLQLISTTCTSSDSKLYLHPFLWPESIKVHSSQTAKIVEEALLTRFNFCDDGKVEVDTNHVKSTFGVECKIEDNGRRRQWAPKKYFAQQYVSRSGTLFIRLLLDQNDSVLFVIIENCRQLGKRDDIVVCARRLLAELNDFVRSIENADYRLS